MPQSWTLRGELTEEGCYAGLSFSFSHTNDVVLDHSCSPWQVCESEPQQTVLGPDRRNAKTRRGRRGDKAHREAEKQVSSQDIAPLAPRKLDTIFNWEFPLNTWPPAEVGYWCGSRARAPQLDSFQILRRFHVVFSPNACLEFFPETGDIASRSWICALLVKAARIQMASRSFPVWNSSGSAEQKGKYAQNICYVDLRSSLELSLQAIELIGNNTNSKNITAIV